MTAPTRRRRIAAPVGVAAVAIAGAVVLYVRDPRTASYLPCPFHALTGLWCPGCGTTRALGDLTRGDVAAAASSNVAAVVAVVAAVGIWILLLRARWSGRSLPAPSRTTVIPIVVAFAVFTVLRNTPWGASLAPT